MIKRKNKLNKKTLEDSKLSFRIIEAMLKGFKRMKHGEMQRITTFTENYIKEDKRSQHHVNSVRKKLTEYFYMNEVLKGFNLYLDNDGRVKDIERKLKENYIEDDIKEIKWLLENHIRNDKKKR